MSLCLCSNVHIYVCARVFAPLTHQVEAAEASFAEASASAQVAKLAAMPVVKTFANVSAPDASERVGQLQGGFVKGQVRLRLCVFVCARERPSVFVFVFNCAYIYVCACVCVRVCVCVCVCMLYMHQYVACSVYAVQTSIRM